MTGASLVEAFPCLASDLQRVEDVLTGTPWIEGEPELTRLVGHLMGGVPKLVRPTFVLSSAYLCGDPRRPAPDAVVQAAVAIEHVHVGTMCHDDVMDEAGARRARDSVNARWGNAMAILSGDYHLARAAEVAALLGLEACGIVAGTFKALCQGQMIETADRHSTGRTVEAYERAIAGKTAALLSASCRMGAVHAGAPAAAVEALASFGMRFGIAFQIHDDVLDLTETSEALGKPAANDILEGVYTLPVILALRRRPELEALLRAPVSKEDARRAREVVLASGAIEEAIAVGRERFRSAVAAVGPLGARPPHVSALVAYAEDMLPAFRAAVEQS